MRPPWAAGVLAFALLAVGCALFLGRSHDVTVSRAVLDAQERLALDTAEAVRGSIEENAQDLDHAATALTSTPDTDPVVALAAFGKAHRKWRGLALLDAVTGRLVAFRGESVPVETLRGQRFGTSTARLVVPRVGQPRLLTIAPVTPPGAAPRLLVASSVPRLAAGVSRPHSGTASYLLDDHGHVVNSLGQLSDAKRLRPLVGAARKHAQHGSSGTLLGPRARSGRWVVGYAPVYDHRSSVSLNAVTVRVVADGTAERGDRRLGPALGKALGGLVVVVFGLLYLTSVRPLRRLAREARRLAGGELMRPVAVSRVREARDLGCLLEELRRGVRRETTRSTARPRRRRAWLSLRSVLVVGAVLLAGWSLAVPALVSARTPRPVPADVVTAQRERVASAADAVRRTVNEGVFDLASIANLVGGRRDGQAMRVLLDEVLQRHGRYRSVYVLDRAGKVTARVGPTPRRPPGPAPARTSVVQVNHRGRVPIVVAYVPLPSGRGTLVGEYDPTYLAGRLSREGVSRLWLVAPDRRVVAANRGFLAFSALPAADLDAAATRALRGRTTVRLGNVDGTPAVVSAAPVAGNGPATALQWAVIAEHPVSQLATASYDMRRHALLIGMLGVVATLLVFGWEYLVVLRPLRRAVTAAQALVAGDRETMRYPERHDEVGDIMRGLERLRLALVSPRRPAARAGRRLPYTERASEETELLPIVIYPQRNGSVGSVAHRELSGHWRG